MNSKERLTRCYFNQETDRPGVYNRTGYPLNDPSYDRLKAYLWENTELKDQWNARALEVPYNMEYNTQPYSEEYEKISLVLHAPAGDLTSVMFRSLQGKEDIRESYFIKEPKDAQVYLSLPLPEIKDDISLFHEKIYKISDKGIVEVDLGVNPAGTVVEELLGPENFALMSVTEPDVIHALCERQYKIMEGTVKYVLVRKLGPFFTLAGQECIVPPMHGVKDFYDFNLKYDKPIIDLIHNAGGRIHVHFHGSIKKVLPGFLEMGVDVLHPFEAPPMGDITAAEAKEMVRGKMCIEGNIQIADMYEQTPEQIREQTEQLINDTYDDHMGLIVCPTASSYIYGKGLDCYKQYKTMVDTVLKYI